MYMCVCVLRVDVCVSVCPVILVIITYMHRLSLLPLSLIHTSLILLLALSDEMRERISYYLPTHSKKLANTVCDNAKRSSS